MIHNKRASDDSSRVESITFSNQVYKQLFDTHEL